MPSGLPDFWQGSIAGMPTIGAGQVAWYMSDNHLVTAGEEYDLINYVVPDLFELHVCSGVVSCGLPRLQRYDLRQTPAGTWVSPTGFSDPDNKWEFEENAFDGNIVTYAQCWCEPEAWSAFLELTWNEVIIDSLKFYGKLEEGWMEDIDLDVWYEGAWHHVYEDFLALHFWQTKAIPAGAKLCSKARIRVKNLRSWQSNIEFYALMYNTVGVTPQKGTFFDTHAIIPYLPQAPYIVEPRATFAVRVYNDDEANQNMSVSLAGFLQKKTM